METGIDSFDHLPKVTNPANPKGRIIYGISKVRPRSIMLAVHRDGRVANRIVPEIDGSTSNYNGVESIEDLNRDNTTNRSYNEVAMMRYDEKGEPMPVDFMVTDDKYVMEQTENEPEVFSDGLHTSAYYMNAIKNHAAEHGVPVVLVERDYYPSTPEDYEKNLDKLLDIMSPEEIFGKMSEEHRNERLREFLGGDDAKTWDMIQRNEMREKLEQLTQLSNDVDVKEAWSNFLLMNGLG